MTFISGRFFFLAYLMIVFGLPFFLETLFLKEGVSFAYKLLMAEFSFAVMINVLLNFYWSFLIIRQLYRLIRGNKNAGESYAGNETMVK